MSVMFTSLIGTSDAPIPVVEIPKTVFRLLDAGYDEEYFTRPLIVIAPADSPDNIIDWGNGTTSTYGAGRTWPDVKLRAAEREKDCWEECWWDEELDEEVCEEYCVEGELIPTYEYTVTIYGNHTGVYIDMEWGSIELLELSPNLKQFRYSTNYGSLKFPKGFHLPATVSDWSYAFEYVDIYGETDIETLLAEWTDNDPVERNVEMMFYNAGLTGRAPAEKLWLSNNTWSSTYDCFYENCDLENYDEIPENWGGGGPPHVTPLYFVVVAVAQIDYNGDSSGFAYRYAQALPKADGTYDYRTIAYDGEQNSFGRQELRHNDFFVDCAYEMSEDREYGKVYKIDRTQLYEDYSWCPNSLIEAVDELCYITEVGEIPKDQLPTNVPGTDPYYVAIVSETNEEEFEENWTHRVDVRGAYQDEDGAWRILQGSNVHGYDFEIFCSRGDIMECNWAGGSMGVVGRLAEGEL